MRPRNRLTNGTQSSPIRQTWKRDAEPARVTPGSGNGEPLCGLPFFLFRCRFSLQSERQRVTDVTGEIGERPRFFLFPWFGSPKRNDCQASHAPPPAGNLFTPPKPIPPRQACLLPRRNEAVACARKLCETKTVISRTLTGTPFAYFSHPKPNISRVRSLGWSQDMKAFRILVADDHELVRRGIRVLLENHPGWEVSAEAKDGREAVERASELKPDLVLLDIGMPNLNGIDAARQILATCPPTHILILTMHYSPQVVQEVLAVGARGFLLKSDAGRDLVTAIDAVQHNRTFFTSQVTEIVVDGYLNPDRKDEPPLKNRLTPRERQVVQLLAEGKTSKEVAVSLNLSVKTAETHRTNIMRKLGLHSVADLTLYALRHGIVQVF